MIWLKVDLLLPFLQSSPLRKHGNCLKSKSLDQLGGRMWPPNCLLPWMVKEHVFLINDTYVVFFWFDMHFLKDMWVRWTCRTAFSFYGARKTCALAWFARAVVTGSNSCWEWPDVANWPTQPETAQPTAPTPTKWPNSALHKPTAGQSAGPNTSGAQPGTAKSRRAHFCSVHA